MNNVITFLFFSFSNFPTTAFKLLCKELTIIFNSVSHSGIHNPELDPMYAILEGEISISIILGGQISIIVVC